MRNNRLIKNVLLNPPIFGLRKDASSVSNLVTSYLDTCDVIIEVGLLSFVNVIHFSLLKAVCANILIRH